MLLVIAHPQNGTCKSFEVTDETLLEVNLADFYLGSCVDGEIFGEKYRGYRFRLRGGSDKQGFPMIPGVGSATRTRLLLKQGSIGYTGHRAKLGERRKKSVRGSILSKDIAALNVVIMKVGEEQIPGVTDIHAPSRLGPKRATKIRKLFNVPKGDDVKKYAIRRQVTKEGKKTRNKVARVQRLITKRVRARRAAKVEKAIKKLKENAVERKSYLKKICRVRMVNRQRKHARKLRQKSAVEKDSLMKYEKSGPSKSKAKVAKK